MMAACGLRWLEVGACKSQSDTALGFGFILGYSVCVLLMDGSFFCVCRGFVSLSVTTAFAAGLNVWRNETACSVCFLPPDSEHD